jgi:hypothetical protein
MSKRGVGRPRKVGRPRIHPIGWKGHKKVGRPRKVGRPAGIHTKWGRGKKVGRKMIISPRKFHRMDASKKHKYKWSESKYGYVRK